MLDHATTLLHPFGELSSLYDALDTTLLGEMDLVP